VAFRKIVAQVRSVLVRRAMHFDGQLHGMSHQAIERLIEHFTHVLLEDFEQQVHLLLFVFLGEVRILRLHARHDVFRMADVRRAGRCTTVLHPGQR